MIAPARHARTSAPTGTPTHQEGEALDAPGRISSPCVSMMVKTIRMAMAPT